MDKIDITPQQMKAIANRMSEVYPTMYTAGQPSQPHYEHIVTEKGMFKIGFIPGESNSRTVMNIRIVYKGRTNGN